MIELLGDVLRVSTIVFTVTSMLSVGFSYSLAEILGPIRNVRIVLRALAANFVLVPLLALLLARALPLDPPRALGLFILACSAGAPFLIKLLDAARGDVGKGATLLVLLTPATIVFLPLAVSWALAHPALTGIAFGRVDAWAIARPLLVTLLLPLAVGLLVRGRAPGLARRLQPTTARTATAAVVVVIGSAVLANLRGLVALLGVPMVAVLLLFLGAFAIGYSISGPRSETRVVVGLGTGLRGIAPATVVATETVRHPDCTTLVVAGSVLGLLALLPIAGALGKRRTQPLPGAATVSAS